MNPALAGLTSGVALSLLGLLVIWPALGRGLLPVLGRLTAIFLGKLAAILVLVLVVHDRAPAATAPFAVSLAATVVVLLLAQAALLAWRLKQVESKQTSGPGPGEGAG
ncbi:MAG: hypothetical protein WC326_07935 [Candidatus Delongbacteria bacterium]